MLTNRIRSVIKEGEGLRVEFKTCKNAINKDVYQTVCAFLNRYGGEILLGVDDAGTITGIDPAAIDHIKKDFVTAVNNPLKIAPTVFLSINQLEIDGKLLLYIFIPQSSKVYLKDYQTGKEGFSLAGILLFGKDETILSVIPHHKTDLILRRENLDRYDDRDDVRTNLIDSYDRIIAFGQKHLADPFYLEGTQRVSARDKIMRELASNILIHREYIKAFPAKIIFEENKILAENGNRATSYGSIDPDNFTPCPKNPVIAGVFRQMGLADELGSGVRNLFKYTAVFSKSQPELLEADIFRVTIHLTDQATEQVTEQVMRLLKCLLVKSGQTQELMNELGLNHRPTFIYSYIKPAMDFGLVEMTQPDAPKSPTQKYRLSGKGKLFLQGTPHA
ncbi:hypothetical protein MASR2M78_24820 [Treponema sp.]